MKSYFNPHQILLSPEHFAIFYMLCSLLQQFFTKNSDRFFLFPCWIQVTLMDLQASGRDPFAGRFGPNQCKHNRNLIKNKTKSCLKTNVSVCYGSGKLVNIANVQNIFVNPQGEAVMRKRGYRVIVVGDKKVLEDI